MSRTVYVNGEYVAEEAARISVFDRGFLFADGVYEVTPVLGGKLIDLPDHLARLRRSLRELEMPSPADDAEIEAIHRGLMARNALAEGMVYLQITRGPAERDFAYPAEPRPSLVAFTQARALIDAASALSGIKVLAVPDIRWGRRDIKTVQLLAPSMCKMMARRAGCDDAWMIEDGFVTEGTSNNAWIVTRAGVIVTRDLSSAILQGVTRAAVISYARAAQMSVEERPFTLPEAQAAAEAFVTAATAFVTPVVEIDGAAIGNGAPGPVATRLREIYIAESLARAR